MKRLASHDWALDKKLERIACLNCMVIFPDGEDVTRCLGVPWVEVGAGWLEPQPPQ